MTSMYFAKVVESDNRAFQGYQELIPIDEFIGYVDSPDFLAKQHVTYTIYSDNDGNGERDPVYEGKYTKGDQSITDDVEGKLQKLWHARENVSDINLVAEAFGLPTFLKYSRRGANPTRAAPKPPRRKRKLVFTVLAIVMVILLSGFIFYGKSMIPGLASPETIRPSAEKLIEQDRYDELAKFYPNRFKQVENKMVTERSLEGLKMLQRQVKGNHDLTFDEAFLKHDWASVIKHSTYDLDDTHKARLAVAYIYDGQPDSALALNSELQSKTLSQLVFLTLVHRGEFDQAERVGKSLNQDDVQKILKAAKTYQEAYEKAKQEAKDTSLSSSDRKKAADNRDNFLNLRKTIGGTTEYESTK